TMSVTPAALTITANDQSKTYGDSVTFDGTEFSADGLKNHETIGTVSLASSGAAATVGVNGGAAYDITASGASGGTFDAGNYDISYVDGDLTVSKASLTVTANNQTKTYGDTFSFDGTEFSIGSGELKNGETIGTVSLASGGTSATAGVNGGTPYTITASGASGGSFDAGNYDISYVSGGLTVNKAALTITADDQVKTYGDTFSFDGTEFSTNGLKNHETVGTVSLSSSGAATGAGVNGGTPYSITASGGSGGSFDAGNYDISYVGGDLTVNKASLTVTANNQTKTYGDTFSFDGTEFSANGLKNHETIGTVSLSSSGASATVGVNGGTAYSITASNASGGTFDADNYDISYATGGLTVNKAALAITADNQTKTYGDTFSFDGTEFSTNGLKNHETIGTVSLASSGSAATAGVNGSTPYSITASGAFGGSFDADNYNISYASGGLTVNKAALTVTASNQSKTYGDTFSFDGTEFTTGSGQLKNGDTVTGVTLTSSGTAATANVNGGTPYTITASGATGSQFDAGNYDIAYVAGGLTVTPAHITVTALGGSSTYGDSPSNPGLSATGLKNGQTASVLTGLSNSFGIGSTTNAGTYTLDVDGTLANGNYSITNRTAGQWLVNRAALTITADDQEKTYGDTFSFDGPEFTTDGLKNHETVGTISLSSSGASATAGVNGRTPYSITGSGVSGGTFDASNYDITYVSGGLTVNKASLTVTADGASKTYDGLGYSGGNGVSYSGFVNGEGASMLGGTIAYGGSAQGAVNAGSYTIAASGLTSGNYDISYVSGGL
ncbi:MAG: hypothetical protein KGI75_29210, partial [Rhizobiaceae bacterium]|nr:hypothetical protein [Rhizobiaceae bacterium]